MAGRHISGLKRAGAAKYLYAVLLLMLLGVCLNVGWAAEGGHGEAAPKGWVATDWYRVMNFTVLAVGLFLLLRKPVSQALNDRINGIETQLKDLEQKKLAAEKQLADYNERLSLLDKEAEKIVSDYLAQGKEAKVRIMEEAKKASAKFEEQARRNIETEFNRARKALQTEIIEKSLLKAEDIIQVRISEEDQDRLVDEYIEKVVA